MTIDKFLHFLMSHNATIIEVMIALTLLAVLFLSVRMFLFAKEPAGSPSNMDLGQMEVTLKKILEKAGQVSFPGNGGETSAGSEDSQKLLAEIQNLKVELESRQRQIEAMKSAPAEGESASPGLSAADKEKMESQIQELQAKLSEYEIISEDIADLSFYKEQNVKLQKEIEALKSGGAAETPVASPVPSPTQPPVDHEPAPNVNALEEALVDSVKMEVPSPAQETQEVPEVGEKNVIDDDLMAEFAAAVEKQKASTEISNPPVPPAGESSPEESVDLGQMDMDKMLAEAAEIKTDVPDVDPEKALGTQLDENKLLEEAAALEGVSSEDKKLMGDFENFVKKSES